MMGQWWKDRRALTATMRSRTRAVSGQATRAAAAGASSAAAAPAQASPWM
jgi:hypothetical protein